MPNEHFIRLFRHNRWANRLIMEACQDLSSDQLATSAVGTYGALGPTLAHLAAAEAGYAWRFDQDPDRFNWDDDEPVPPVTTLAGVLEVTGTRFIELASTTPDDRQLSYVVEGGEERRWPAWVILGQVIDHAREHRSHAATILTQLGIEPPDMDMWAYAMAVQAGETE
jgi:uncharacterized damage-inducible protein DinB